MKFPGPRTTASAGPDWTQMFADQSCKKMSGNSLQHLTRFRVELLAKSCNLYNHGAGQIKTHVWTFIWEVNAADCDNLVPDRGRLEVEGRRSHLDLHDKGHEGHAHVLQSRLRPV